MVHEIHGNLFQLARNVDSLRTLESALTTIIASFGLHAVIAQHDFIIFIAYKNHVQIEVGVINGKIILHRHAVRTGTQAALRAWDFIIFMQNGQGFSDYPLFLNAQRRIGFVSQLQIFIYLSHSVHARKQKADLRLIPDPAQAPACRAAFDA